MFEFKSIVCSTKFAFAFYFIISLLLNQNVLKFDGVGCLFTASFDKILVFISLLVVILQKDRDINDQYDDFMDTVAPRSRLCWVQMYIVMMFTCHDNASL